MKVDLSHGGSVSGDDIRLISLNDWIAEGEKLFGVDKKNWRYVCAHCGHVQSHADFFELNTLGISDVSPETAYMSCIGRFDTRIKNVGTLDRKGSPCNYTLGGLFVFAKTFVIGSDGKNLPVFEFYKGDLK